MVRTEFTGRALTFEEQLRMLAGQGLVIADEERALRILCNVGYTRLKSYLIPLMEDRQTHTFRSGVSIEDAYALYGFDRRFRELVFHEMEKIEISVRTRMAYVTMNDDGGWWFTNPAYFASRDYHSSILRRLEGEIARSDDDAIVRFREKHTNKFPPCWITFEASSMGLLSVLYDAMKPGWFKRKLAGYYGVTDVVFASWLHHLVYVRNICAHHGRLWNRTLSIKAMIPRNTGSAFADLPSDASSHIYLTLCIIKYLINIIKPSNTFSARVKILMNSFPQVNLSLMGFPEGWSGDEFWR